MVSLPALADTVRLTAQAVDARGKTLPNAAFTWSSSAAGVASVNQTGRVTAVSNGAAVITATSDGITGTASVTVAQKVSTVSVTPTSASLNAVGASVTLTALAQDANGHTVEGATFAWTTSIATVVTVDSAGVVTAAGGGTAVVTATAQGVSASASVTVSQVATTVVVAPATVQLTALGDTARLTAVARDANGHAIPGKRLTWSSSATGVATVDTTGLVMAVTNGIATISAVADGIASTALATVAQELAAVTVAPDTASIVTLGATEQLTATARDARGYAIAGRAFAWTSSNISVATVDASGFVTAVANGTASITATVEGRAGTGTVTVAQKAATVVLSPAGATLTGVGATRQLTVAARDAGGSVIPPAGVHATWTSLIPGVATVNSSGLAIAVGAGQVTIQVDVDGVVQYVTLTVGVPGLPPVNLWARMESGVPEKIESLWGTSATDVFATSHWRVLHYDGTAWSTAALFFGFLNMGIWGSSAQDVHVGGRLANIIHYDGTLWSLSSSGLCNMIPSMWGASPRDIFGVCWDGTIVHFDGTSWTFMDRPPSIGLHRVWGTFGKDVYALGMGAAPGSEAVLHYDGTSWNVISTGLSGALGLWGTSGTNIYAAGVGGNVYHYDGTRWSQVAFGAPIQVWSIWGSSATDVYFTGVDTLGSAAVLRYDGTNTWDLARGASHDTLQAIWGAPTGEVFAAGARGAIYRGYRNGTMGISPSVVTIGGSNNRLQLSALPGSGGALLSGVPITWTSFNPSVATVDEDGWVTGLAEGTAAIRATAFGGATATATVTVILTQKPPVARIDSPSKDTILTLGESVTFQGAASDPDGTIASHVWDFGDGSGASVEDPGPYTYGDTGSYKVTYRVTDNDGASSPLASVLVRVVLNQSPTATISSPADQATYAPGVPVTFSGSGADHEDGGLTGASLVWTSSRDGPIGTGTSFTRNDLSLGTHTITLTATDSYGGSGSAAVTVNVAAVSPIATGEWHGSTTGMALEFIVSADARYVTQMKYTFSGLQCGGVTLASGSVTRSTTPGWEITNRQFTISPTQSVPGITGTFGDDGTTVTGTWTWLTCSGSWTGAHP